MHNGLFRKNYNLLRDFAHRNKLKFVEENAENWPHMLYMDDHGRHRAVYVRHEGRITVPTFSLHSARFDSKDVLSFKRWLYPTEDECILFEIETGRKYIFAVGNTYRWSNDA